MNSTQTRCKWTKEYDNFGEVIYHQLPKVGGIELRIHKPDGKDCYYFCSIQCMNLWINDETKRIID